MACSPARSFWRSEASTALRGALSSAFPAQALTLQTCKDAEGVDSKHYALQCGGCGQFALLSSVACHRVEAVQHLARSWGTPLPVDADCLGCLRRIPLVFPDLVCSTCFMGCGQCDCRSAAPLGTWQPQPHRTDPHEVEFPWSPLSETSAPPGTPTEICTSPSRSRSPRRHQADHLQEVDLGNGPVTVCQLQKALLVLDADLPEEDDAQLFLAALRCQFATQQAQRSHKVPALLAILQYLGLPTDGGRQVLLNRVVVAVGAPVMRCSEAPGISGRRFTVL